MKSAVKAGAVRGALVERGTITLFPNFCATFLPRMFVLPLSIFFVRQMCHGTEVGTGAGSYLRGASKILHPGPEARHASAAAPNAGRHSLGIPAVAEQFDGESCTVSVSEFRYKRQVFQIPGIRQDT